MITADVLWSWSGAESGNDRMRWNNPLNTTQPWGSGNRDANSVGVKIYPTLEQGIAATVATLRNGRYPTIVSYLRKSVPRSQWGPACGELGTWGTGCRWLRADYGAAPKEASSQGEQDDMTPGQEAVLNQVYLMVRTGAAASGDPAAAIAALPAGGDSLLKQVNEITLKRMEEEILELKGRLELIEQAPAIGAEHVTPPGP